MSWQDRFSLKGRKALITGASKGIGAEIAAVFAEAGADIVALGRDEADLAATARTVRDHGRRCLTLVAEMASPTEPVAACERALSEWGTIDILVNSAGIALVAPALEFSTEDWDRLMAVNLRAPFLTMQRAVAAMKERGEGGSIVNIISMAALCGQSYLLPYSVSKGGLMTLTKNVANAFAKDRIRCNGILTGWMETPGEAEIQRRFHGGGSDWAEQAARRLPMGQLVQPDQLAGLIAYIAGPEAGVMTGSLIEYDQFVAGAYPE